MNDVNVLVIPSVIADEDERMQLGAAMPGSRFIVCELTAPKAVLKERAAAADMLRLAADTGSPLPAAVVRRAMRPGPGWEHVPQPARVIERLSLLGAAITYFASRGDRGRVAAVRAESLGHLGDFEAAAMFPLSELAAWHHRNGDHRTAVEVALDLGTRLGNAQSADSAVFPLRHREPVTVEEVGAPVLDVADECANYIEVWGSRTVPHRLRIDLALGLVPTMARCDVGTPDALVAQAADECDGVGGQEYRTCGVTSNWCRGRCSPTPGVGR